jgi:hypothetical protein
VELHWHRLREIEIEKGRQLGVAVFGGKEGEEARRLHGAEGGRHSEERCNGRGGRRWRLEVEDDQRKLNRWVECIVGSNC